MIYPTYNGSNIFSSVIGRATRNPVEMHHQLQLSGNRINNINDAYTVTAKDLPPRTFSSINAICSPCLVVAKVIRDNEGELVEASAAHFSANVSATELDYFLGTPPENKSAFIAVAGLAQMEDRHSLGKRTSKVADRLHRFGLPVFVEAGADGRPIIINDHNGQVISDIGMGIITEEERVDRWISLVTSNQHSMLVSTATTDCNRARHTQLMTDFGETLLLRPD
ncbi:MAG TPA: hypothetical protein VMD02_02165, partial [Candidatus Omnitrophota bacterium]|nr:hypothetical protein [Candidatus Omnitrophota bacterium]